jgi:hypothetical protein
VLQLIATILGSVLLSFRHDKITYIDNYFHVPADRCNCLDM